MKLITFVICMSLAIWCSSCSRPEKEDTYPISEPRQQIDHGHAAFTKVLAKYLKDGRVDYAGLKNDPGPLNAYLDTLAAVPESAFKRWSRQQQMAFLINLYNAATLKLIADHYPVKSIKDIGGIFKGPWKQPVVRLFGKFTTLDYLEHGLLRPRYKDPRVHFAVNCASIGCPDLRPEAYQAAKLDAQLEEQGRAFLRDTSRNHVDRKNKTLHLSPIFDWFKEDFTAESGSVEKFVAPYFKDADRKAIETGGFSIKNTRYDWALNE